MRTPRTHRAGSRRGRLRVTGLTGLIGLLRWFLDRWDRWAGGDRPARRLRDAITTTSRWFRHTLPRTADRWLRAELPAAARRLRDGLPDPVRRLRAGLGSERLRGRATLAALVLALAVVPMALTTAEPTGPNRPDLSAALAQRAEASDTPARSRTRVAAPSDPVTALSAPSAGPTSSATSSSASPTPSESQAPPMTLAAAPTPSPEPSPTPSAKPSPKPSPTPERVRPIGGLDESQMEHAATIVRVGQQMGLPKQAYVVALATALQESYLRNLANPAYPESYNYPNDGSGYDHDSVGLFQQRPSMGWGTVAQIMDPEYSARAFYEQLRRVPGWQNMPVTVAAQTVQVSAFPDHYAKHEPLARQLVDALT